MPARFRYEMDHPISRDELEPLVSGLEDEPEFLLAELLGPARVAELLAGAHLAFDVTVPERFFAFGKSLAVISIYLSEYVSGVEVVEHPHVEAYRYVARQGELICVPLEHAVGLDREVVVGREDLAALRARWPELPRWARVAYKQTFDELADLDA